MTAEQRERAWYMGLALVVIREWEKEGIREPVRR